VSHAVPRPDEKGRTLIFSDCFATLDGERNFRVTTMEKYEILINYLEETLQLAERLSRHLKPGDVLCLEGDLGAGKTSFTKGIAKGLGVEETVKSPTFTIIREYEGKEFPLYHMDVYRLKDSREDLGFDEYFHGDGVTVVEWAHLIEDQLPDQYLAIRFFIAGENRRRLFFEPRGERYKSLCKEFFHEYFGH